MSSHRVFAFKTVRWSTLALWFSIGLLINVRLNIFGEIYIGEVIAFTCFAASLSTRRPRRVEAFLLSGCLIWSFAQGISDVINSTSTLSAAKGILTPILFGTTCIGLFRMIKGPPQVVGSLLIGMATTTILSSIIAPTEYQTINSWKFGIGNSILTIGCCLLSFFFINENNKKILLSALFLVVFFATSIHLNSRAIAIIPLLGFFLYIGTAYSPTRKVIALFQGKAPLLFVIPILLSVIVFVNTTASALFASGHLENILPADVHAKFKTQASSSVGLILAGRSEWLISIDAFMDSPLIGHGSWAEDKSGYLMDYLLLRYEVGATEVEDPLDPSLTLIPAHSYLMQAAVWSGITGALFWLILSNAILRTYLAFYTKLPLYFHVFSVNFIWSILFSPFGASARWSTAVYISTLAFFVIATQTKAGQTKGI